MVGSHGGASTYAAKEAIWLRAILSDLAHSPTEPTSIHCDNLGTIVLTKDSTFHACSKHINIRHHFVRERVESQELNVLYTLTAENIANVLTKGLPKPKHNHFTNLLRLHLV
jgi:hypothetical protein